MIKVIAIRNITISHGPMRLVEGEIYELPDEVAEQLIALGDVRQESASIPKQESEPKVVRRSRK